MCPGRQLDRLSGAVGLDTVELGIIPFGASLKIPPATAFRVYDDSRVIVATWHSGLWIEGEASVSTYLRTWNTLRESAGHGADAHRVITAAGRALNVARQREHSVRRDTLRAGLRLENSASRDGARSQDAGVPHAKGWRRRRRGVRGTFAGCWWLRRAWW